MSEYPDCPFCGAQVGDIYFTLDHLIRDHNLRQVGRFQLVFLPPCNGQFMLIHCWCAKFSARDLTEWREHIDYRGGLVAHFLESLFHV